MNKPGGTVANARQASEHTQTHTHTHIQARAILATSDNIIIHVHKRYQ